MSYNLHTHRAPSHVLDRSEAGPGVRPPCIRPGSGDVGPPSSREKKIINSRWNMHSLTSACCHLSRNSEKTSLLNLPGFHLVLDLLDKKRENFETVYAYYKDCLHSCRGIWINKSKWTTSVSLGYYLNVYVDIYRNSRKKVAWWFVLPKDGRKILCNELANATCTFSSC